MKLHLNNRPDCRLVQSCVVEPVGDGSHRHPRTPHRHPRSLLSGGGDDAGDGDTGDGAATGRHRFFIDGVWYRGSLILRPDSVEAWAVDSAADLTAAHFAKLAASGAEVVILGTGARAIFPHASLTQALMTRRIGLEVMDTPAACRTYNILAADGRPVVAGLIA